MKKFTLMIVAALFCFTGASAQIADADTTYYGLASDGAWSLADTLQSQGDIYYRTWVSNDSLVTITFDGYVYDYRNYDAEKYTGYYDVMPGDITINCKDGYHVDQLIWQGGAVYDVILVMNNDEPIAVLDTTATSYSWIQVDKNEVNPLVLTVQCASGDYTGNLQMYDPSANYGYIKVIPDTPTGINSVATEKKALKDDAWYDLTGRRVATPGKGIYIRNGKKFVVK